jgi:acetyl esterase/lipase
MRRFLCLLAALVLAAPAMAQGPSFEALAERRKTVSAPALVERYGPDDLRRGELRLPRGAGPFPVAVLIHGGCWSAAMDDWTGTAPLADALAARGIASWNIEYRRVGNPGGGYPGTLEDVAAGVDHLRSLAGRFPLDLSRLTIAGHSAGAHLALWAASRRGLGGPGGGDPLLPASVVAIDGPGELAPFIGPDGQGCGFPAITRLMGGTPAAMPDAYRIATPAARLPLGLRQLFVLGDLAPFMTGYIDAASLRGDMVVRIAPGGADHFNIIDPATPQGREVADFIAAQAFPRR